MAEINEKSIEIKKKSPSFGLGPSQCFFRVPRSSQPPSGEHNSTVVLLPEPVSRANRCTKLARLSLPAHCYQRFTPPAENNDGTTALEPENRMKNSFVGRTAGGGQTLLVSSRGRRRLLSSHGIKFFPTVWTADRAPACTEDLGRPDLVPTQRAGNGQVEGVRIEAALHDNPRVPAGAVHRARKLSARWP